MGDEAAPAVGSFVVAVRPSAVLRDAQNSTVRCRATSPHLVGDWGEGGKPGPARTLEDLGSSYASTM